MDQSPVYFCMTQKQTMAKSGSRTVNGRTTKNPTKHVTVALTVMASGTFLPPVVIFEGQPKGCIAQMFSTFNDSAKYCPIQSRGH